MYHAINCGDRHILVMVGFAKNKAGYTATLVACRWAGAVLEKVNRASGQELYALKAQKRQNSKKGTNQTS